MKSRVVSGVMMIVVSALLIAGIRFDVTRAVDYGSLSTTVGGIVWENTTWTLENSPYLITDTVQIPENVTLTIEPGVTVLSSLDSYDEMFLLHGLIRAQGTVCNEIVFDGGGNSHFFNAEGSNDDTFLDLDYCIIRNGLSFWWDGHGHFNLTHSELTDLTDYSHIWYPARDIYIEYNKFVNTGGFSIGHDENVKVYVRYNLFKSKNPNLPTYADFCIQNWASYDESETIVKYNSFIDMDGTVVKLPAGYNTAAMTATENYWGTTNTEAIDSMIYDENDDINCAGFIDYLPILSGPHPDTPTLCMHTWTVDDDGVADFHTIQEAINAACDGDTIYIRTGTYYENIIVNKTVTLVGENRVSTLVDGEEFGSVVNVTANHVAISNITTRNSGTTWPGVHGITLGHVKNCNISGNTMTDNEFGIWLEDSSNNTISGNEIANNGDGISLSFSSDCNTISGNNITDNYAGIEFFGGSNNNAVFGNEIMANNHGIFISASFDNTVLGNNITDNVYGIYISRGTAHVSEECSRNIIAENNISTNNYTGIVVTYCGTNVFCNNSISLNRESGIYLTHADNNTLSDNNTSNNKYGIHLESSSHNSFSGNNITNNGLGINLSDSSNNSIYHNNIVNNADQIDSEFSTNVWNNCYPSGGNYWSDYAGVDLYGGPFQNETGNDGIGDTPYIIAVNNTDNYPLMTPFGPPAAIFTYSPCEPVVNEVVIFNASATYDYEGCILTYEWNFGDGKITTTSNPITSHTYTPSGTYIVTLKVTDNDGLSDANAKSIDVGKIPTSVSISTSSPSTFVGFRANITGSLRDMSRNGLGDKIVVLYYSFGGFMEWVPFTSDITDNLGRYQVTWIPPATGYFLLKAEWAGNTTHSETSNTTTLSSLVYDNQYVFSVESNSTISELAFDTKNWKLSFAATGPNGTRGYVKVTVAKTLVADIANIRVFLDGKQSDFEIISTDDSWLLTFVYEHSIHQVEVELGAAEVDTTPPTILVLSPENETVYPENNITLTFTVDEPAYWMGYSLDGQTNVTITGNTTLSDLLDGSHYVTVYANDTVGNMGASSTVYFTVDTTPPNITDVSQTPLEDNVQPEDEVKVNATVIDVTGDVEQVTLNYTNGNGTWVTIEMTSLSVPANVWSATIPPFPYGTNVTYIVIAEDATGNIVTSEELGYDTQYQVVPEFPPFLILLLFMMATLLAVMVYRRKNLSARFSRFPITYIHFVV